MINSNSAMSIGSNMGWLCLVLRDNLIFLLMRSAEVNAIFMPATRIRMKEFSRFRLPFDTLLLLPYGY